MIPGYKIHIGDSENMDTSYKYSTAVRYSIRRMKKSPQESDCGDFFIVESELHLQEGL